ncbi:hypothetical protein ABVG11_13720 [Streptomyces sp. HD1123-B1]|uniref:hypothetical protein n=1 Tax=Streptomyces huangiella TaxID=3228804 RepID=UPI003D7F16A1
MVVDLLGTLVLPTGTVGEGQTPEQAAQDVLRGLTDDLPVRRRVALSWMQTRRRKVITHLLAIPMPRDAVADLIYRDHRATLRVLSTQRVINEVPPPTRLRILLGLQALATGTMAYLEGEAVRPSAPTDLTHH